MADDTEPTVKPWSEVRASAEFRKLKPEQKEAARVQYFDSVVAPKVPKGQLDVARAQFDEHTKLRLPPTMKVDPTEGMSGTEKFLAGTGKAFHDIGIGVRSILPESLGGTTEGEVAEMRRLDAPLMATGAGRAGNIAGNIAVAAPLAFVPGANTVAGSAALGAGMGAIQPAESGGERFNNALVSGATSGLVTGAVRALPAIYRALVDPFTAAGQDRIAMSTIGRFAKDPNALNLSPGKVQAAELVPGAKPTLAEVTGDPGIAQLERAAQSASPETANTFAAVKTAKLAARKDALAKIAGADGEKELFEAMRDTAANRLYGKAFQTPVDPKAMAAVAPRVESLLSRPSIQTAQAEAVRIAKEEGEQITADGSVKSLHYMKKALDGMISKAKAAGDGAEAVRLVNTQKSLLGVIDDLSPAYKAARAEYAEASKPISRMEIGTYLYNKLIPALTDLGGERATPAAYARALKEGDQMAVKATGFKGAKLADILTGPEQDTLVKLGLDLGREVKAAEAGAVKGSPTAQYLTGQNTLRQIAGPLGLPSSWSESLLADTLANRWISAGVKPVEHHVQNRLAQLLSDPSAYTAARAMAQPSVPMSVLNTTARRALPPLAIGAGINQLNGQ